MTRAPLLPHVFVDLDERAFRVTSTRCGVQAWGKEVDVAAQVGLIGQWWAVRKPAIAAAAAAAASRGPLPGGPASCGTASAAALEAFCPAPGPPYAARRCVQVRE